MCWCPRCRHALAGDYVNFGVFELYGLSAAVCECVDMRFSGDPALDTAFDVFFKMVAATPMGDLLVRR
jgi:hypothetical protein